MLFIIHAGNLYWLNAKKLAQFAQPLQFLKKVVVVVVVVGNSTFLKLIRSPGDEAWGKKKMGRGFQYFRRKKGKK